MSRRGPTACPGRTDGLLALGLEVLFNLLTSSRNARLDALATQSVMCCDGTGCTAAPLAFVIFVICSRVVSRSASVVRSRGRGPTPRACRRPRLYCPCGGTLGDSFGESFAESFGDSFDESFDASLEESLMRLDLIGLESQAAELVLDRRRHLEADALLGGLLGDLLVRHPLTPHLGDVSHPSVARRRLGPDRPAGRHAAEDRRNDQRNGQRLAIEAHRSAHLFLVVAGAAGTAAGRAAVSAPLGQELHRGNPTPSAVAPPPRARISGMIFTPRGLLFSTTPRVEIFVTEGRPWLESSRWWCWSPFCW